MAKDNHSSDKNKTSQRPDVEHGASIFSIEKIRNGLAGSIVVKLFMGLLILVFTVGFLFMDPGILGGGGGGGGGVSQVNLGETVASVGKQNITREQLLQAEQYQAQMMAQYGMPITVDQLLESSFTTLQSLAGSAALIQAAKDEGIKVSNQEIDEKIKSDIEEQIKADKEQNPTGFRRQVEARYGSEDGYRKELTQQMQDNREQIKNSLFIEKLQQKVQNDTGASEDLFKRSHTKLKVRQLVVDIPATPADSKDPENAQEQSIATAKATMDKLAKQAKATPTLDNFVKIVKESSDDPQTKEKGGDLGWKIPQEIPVDYPMREALMKSDDKIVGPLQDGTTKAFFLFFVEDRKLDLPKDYEKKKEQYLKDDKTARGDQAWDSYQQDITAKAQDSMQIFDPALQAFMLEKDQILSAKGAEADNLRKQAIDLYQKALKNSVGDQATAVRLQMAGLYNELKQPKKAEEVMATAAKDSPGDPQVLIAYATTLRENKKNDEAAKQLGSASDLLEGRPSTPSMFGSNPDDMLRFQIADEYEALGKKDLAEAERSKIQPPEQPQGLDIDPSQLSPEQ